MKRVYRPTSRFSTLPFSESRRKKIAMSNVNLKKKNRGNLQTVPTMQGTFLKNVTGWVCSVGACVCTRVCLRVCAPIWATGQPQGPVLHCCSPFSEMNRARRTGQCAGARILLSLPPWGWNYTRVPPGLDFSGILHPCLPGAGITKFTTRT